jgi:hypothetical protein
MSHHHMPNPRDVENRRDRLAVRQNKTDLQVCVPADVCLESREIYGGNGNMLIRESASGKESAFIP